MDQLGAAHAALRKQQHRSKLEARTKQVELLHGMTVHAAETYAEFAVQLAQIKKWRAKNAEQEVARQKKVREHKEFQAEQRALEREQKIEKEKMEAIELHHQREREAEERRRQKEEALKLERVQREHRDFLRRKAMEQREHERLEHEKMMRELRNKRDLELKERLEAQQEEAEEDRMRRLYDIEERRLQAERTHNEREALRALENVRQQQKFMDQEAADFHGTVKPCQVKKHVAKNPAGKCRATVLLSQHIEEAPPPRKSVRKSVRWFTPSCRTSMIASSRRPSICPSVTSHEGEEASVTLSPTASRHSVSFSPTVAGL